MEKFIVEIGMGADFHGQDVTDECIRKN
ncbi:MAG TPA: hypothetical protein DCS12_05350 [Clostridiales bacterium]|nr:hypothetical protein [Clostridiales bacterium]